MASSLFLLIVGLIAQSGAALLIAGIFWVLHRRYWRPVLARWTFSWLALAVHAGAGAAAVSLSRFRAIDDPVRFGLALVAGIAGYLQITWLLLGTVELTSGTPVSRRVARWLLCAVALSGAALVVAYAWDPSQQSLIYTLRVTVRRAAVGLAFLVGGVVITRSDGVTPALGRRIVMLAFYCLAAQQAQFVMLTADAAFRAAHPSYLAMLALVDVLLYFVLSIGLVIWLLEEERKATMEAAHKIERIAYHDALTGLPNRKLFLNQLGMALHHARRNNVIVAILFLDLDRFKVVNDSLGHAAGDLLLQTVAERIRVTVRGEDSVTRLGGDEFAVLATEVRDAEDATALAQRIIAAVKRPIMVEGQELFVTTSLGIALYPADGEEPEVLLKNADAAMYRAKAQGRDLVERFVPEMSVSALDQLGLESNLQRALEHSQLVVRYQPIVSSRTGRVVAVEALLRWQHPERGLLPPSEFIGLAEATGAIVPMGEWVLREACAQVAAWRARGQAELRAAVNLSVRQLQHGELVIRVQQILSETGLPADALELEITESIAMRTTGRALDHLRELKALGVRVSIDDLGTGYSSLSALRLFPIDSLKIDRSFVQGVPQNTDDSAIAAAVIALGRTLGVNVIAEGIERPEQLSFFQAHGCDEWQGFLMARPASGPEIEEMLFGQMAGRFHLSVRELVPVG